jgi:7,8-dihydro-6-hydroxymethylpterin-pyrophosphokinase
MLFDDTSTDDKYWEQAFVVVPLAEIHPEFQNPLTHEKISETARKLLRQVWMERRPEVLSRFNASSA